MDEGDEPTGVAPPGGFGARSLAWAVDFALTYALAAVVAIPISTVWDGPGWVWDPDSSDAGASMHMVVMVVPIVVWIVSAWLYEAWLTSSRMQATIGKQLFRLRVTTLSGAPINFAQASARHGAKWLSTVLAGVGYLIQPWTRRRQALHDLVAGTVVVKTPIHWP